MLILVQYNSLRPSDAYICVGKLTIIGSDNGLSPERRQAIIWTNAVILLIGPLGTNFSEISIEIQTFSLKQICLKMLSVKCCPFRLSLNIITQHCTQAWMTLKKAEHQGLTLSIWFTCPSGTWFWKFTCPAKIFMCPTNICTSPVKLYVHCWENKYMPRLKNHLPCRARNHKSLCALRQDLNALGMWACLNVEPWTYFELTWT